MMRSSGLVARTSLLILLALSACTPEPAATAFVPPTAAMRLVTQAAVASPAPSATLSPPTPTSPPASPTPCTNGLRFIQDVTIEDGTNVQPGQRIDKQWLVANSGSCNWDSSYRLKLARGDPMGAQPEQALFPARAGVQVTLRIVFTAPDTAGSYESEWKATAPDGTAFGEPVTIRVNVSPQQP